MRILLVQTAFLGDVVLSTPVIAGIKQCYPNCNLSVLTTPAAAALIERDPLVDSVLRFDKRGKHSGLGGTLRIVNVLRKGNFDKAFSLHKSFRTALVLMLAGIPERIGFVQAKGSWLYHKRRRRISELHDVQRNLGLLAGEEYRGEISDELRLVPPAESSVNSQVVEATRAEGQKIVVIAPGSVWKTKRWHADGFRDCARHYCELGAKVVLAGGPTEVAICRQVGAELPLIDLSGQTSIAELLFLISKSDLVVCNDSMALHVASAFKIPSVVIFCATSPSFGFGPWKNNAKVVEKQGLACKPCARHGANKCPTGTEACMTELSSSEVLRATQAVMEVASND